MEVFKDKNGKDSMKRILGAFGVVSALTMAISKPFVEFGDRWETTLIIGILTASFGAIVMGVFEKKDLL